MNDLTQLNDLRMSSNEIADLTGKEHKNVLRDIDEMLDALEIGRLKFESTYQDSQNKTQRCYQLDKELTMTLVSGYSVKLRHRIVQRWQQLETQPQLSTFQQHIQDRISSNSYTEGMPPGYFNIFDEVLAIYRWFFARDIKISQQSIVDISVGKVWSKKWTDDLLEIQFGPRTKYRHWYPPYYPQAESNPQEPWCYPETVLPIFRQWLREVYLPEKLPNYLKGQAKQGKLAADEVKKLSAK